MTVVGIFVKPQTPGEHGLPKRALRTCTITIQGLEGDFNLYRHKRFKDTPNRAVLLLTTDILRALNNEGFPVYPGDIGENLLLEGLAYDELKAGLRLHVGEIQLEVTIPCTPCKNLRLLPYGSTAFIRTLKDRRGWFAKVIGPGCCSVGDDVISLA